MTLYLSTYCFSVQNDTTNKYVSCRGKAGRNCYFKQRNKKFTKKKIVLIGNSLTYIERFFGSNMFSVYCKKYKCRPSLEAVSPVAEASARD